MAEEPVTKFTRYLVSKHINFSLMNPERSAQINQIILAKSYQNSAMKRVLFERNDIKSKKLSLKPLTKTRNASVQCDKI